MIISKSIDVKISNNQIKYYKSKGYDVKGGNEIIQIKIEDLPNNSGQKILVKCDICGCLKTISMNRYHINTENSTKLYVCSRKCAESKNIETIKNKYGVENISQLKSIKDKKIETCLINHGVEYPQQSKEILEKGKFTNFEKYGNENYRNHVLRNETVKLNIVKKYGAKSYDGENLIFECNNGHEFKITHSWSSIYTGFPSPPTTSEIYSLEKDDYVEVNEKRMEKILEIIDRK
jgi:hypothetical protein